MGGFDFREFTAGSTPPVRPEEPSPTELVGGLGIPGPAEAAAPGGPGALFIGGQVGTAEGTDGLAAVGPPVLILVGAALAAMLGLGVTALLGGSGGSALLGWLLSGPVAFAVLAVYTTGDARRQARPLYVVPRWAKPAYWFVVALALVAVAAAAVRVGIWAGRL